MSRIVPYPDVLHAAEAAGLRCVYPNGAAFGPSNGWRWAVAGWRAGDDGTIRAPLLERTILAPTDVAEGGFGNWMTRAWRDVLIHNGEAWLAPVHHWAAALDHGDDRAGLEAVVKRLHVHPAALAGRRQADAVAIKSPEDLAAVLPGLFTAMGKNDFALLFPPLRVTAMLHHHRQVWWRCEEASLADALLAVR